ncbi:MAG: hypothetical protein DRH50_08310 [Deltaproteobacteria bacterium]|nr:MAG: hypothetical protein DRH50_08310 [Deltaproteobacteria bacterium]
MSAQQSQLFGGSWTEEKLDKLQRYLLAYKTVLKNQPFTLIYIDAFAGTGYREIVNGGSADGQLFTELAESEPQRFLDGSVRIALKVDPPFDEYVFIEASEKRFSELPKIEEDFPQLASRIQLIKGDCNDRLQELCNTRDWNYHRAVLFLDPFGMQVEWNTIEAVAATKAIDVWILFPLGVAVNRMLTRNGEIPKPWRSRLDRLFGSDKWFEEFYEEKVTSTLWGDKRRLEKVANFRRIAYYYMEKLEKVFAGVADNPIQLRNSKGVPLFLLCFAAANPSGARVAIKIAQHILGK